MVVMTSCIPSLYYAQYKQDSVKDSAGMQLHNKMHKCNANYEILSIVREGPCDVYWEGKGIEDVANLDA